MLNVPLLRKTQESILNPKRAFHMHQWCTCIAGHILLAATEMGMSLNRADPPASMTCVNSDFEVRDAIWRYPSRCAAEAAGLPAREAFILFNAHFLDIPNDRSEAVRKLDDLIERLTPETEEPAASSLSGKARSRSPRSKTGNPLPETVTIIQQVDRKQIVPNGPWPWENRSPLTESSLYRILERQTRESFEQDRELVGV